LGSNLKSIDLAPLSSCTNLITLGLGGNRIESVDLAPLGSCRHLQKLYLFGNHLKNIDLTPLNSCMDLQILNLSETWPESVKLCSAVGLKELYLYSNRIESIDLTPLGLCASLQELRLENGSLRSIDLTPLSSCTSLRRLDLHLNELQRIDMTALFSCAQLDWSTIHHAASQNPSTTPKPAWLESLLSKEHVVRLIPQKKDFRLRDPWRYDSPVVLPSMAAISLYLPLVKDKEPLWKAIHLLQGALALCSLQWAGFLDTDPIPLIDHLLGEKSCSINESVREEVSRVLCEQIDKEGTTIGLDMDNMTENRELAIRVSKVLDTRRAEMESASIRTGEGTSDLRALWLTAYGYRILSEMRLGVTCNAEELEMVLHSLREMGFEVGLVDSSELRSPDSISEPMREYIWRLAEYRAQTGGP
jgi:hypothetical protein